MYQSNFLSFSVDISEKVENKGVHKVDIFDAHNFDLDINVDDIQVNLIMNNPV